MIMLMVFGFLTGMLFGLRFAVLILVPTIVLAWALTSTFGAMNGVGFWRIVLDIFVLSTALQVGYLVGAAVSILRDITTAILELLSGSVGSAERRKEVGLPQ
jgi:hypothetical protein